MQFKKIFTTCFICMFIGFGIQYTGASIPNKNISNSESKQKSRYFKIDQGVAAGVVSDRKMSNLHYSGFGFILNFGIRNHAENYISEFNFLGSKFNFLQPDHEGTMVYNPALSMGYSYLRDLDSLLIFDLRAGLQANIFADARMAPRLGNSFLYFDLISELRPQLELSTGFHLFRDWNIDIFAAASLLGYGVRIPEYGTTYTLNDDGGIVLQGFESQFLYPANYGNFTFTLFFRESFGDTTNPNWYRYGYVWDYYTLKGDNNTNVNNAVHQIVFEFYFKVN